MFKYALAVPAIPSLAFSVANIIKSIYGKNKKALVLDLDNTLWEGVIGDDGVDVIAVGPEVSVGQAYSEFQSYVKSLKNIGVILAVSSKNEEGNAIAGLNHPDTVLHQEDFAVIKANWNNKDLNIREIATTLNSGIDSLVFVDDNPTERVIVRCQLPILLRQLI
jgi:FkbH-like protein